MSESLNINLLLTNDHFAVKVAAFSANFLVNNIRSFALAQQIFYWEMTTQSAS